MEKEFHNQKTKKGNKTMLFCIWFWNSNSADCRIIFSLFFFINGVRSDDTKTDVCEEILSTKLSYKSKLGVGICPTRFSIFLDFQFSKKTF